MGKRPSKKKPRERGDPRSLFCRMAEEESAAAARVLAAARKVANDEALSPDCRAVARAAAEKAEGWVEETAAEVAALRGEGG